MLTARVRHTRVAARKQPSGLLISRRGRKEVRDRFHGRACWTARTPKTIPYRHVAGQGLEGVSVGPMNAVIQAAQHLSAAISAAVHGGGKTDRPQQ